MTQQLGFPGRDRLKELLLESRLRTLTTTERVELNETLRAYAEARTLAAQFLVDDAALGDELRATTMESMLAAEAPLVGDPKVAIQSARAEPSAGPRLLTWWTALIASAAMVAIGAWIWSVTPSATPSVSLLAVTDARWAEPNLEFALRAGEIPAEPLRLESGQAEFQLVDGATVIMQGPAVVRFPARKRVAVDSGSVFFKCPTPASRITVVTPQTEVVDLGTEFAVEARSDRSTRVAVRQGEVQVKTAQPRLLRQGEVVAVSSERQLKIELLSSVEFMQLTKSFVDQLPPDAAAANLLVDPGFALGLAPPWQGSEGYAEASAAGGRSGAAVRIRALSNRYWPQIKQQIRTGDISGKLIAASVWAMVPAAERLRDLQYAVLVIRFSDVEGRDFAYASRVLLNSKSTPDKFVRAQVLAAAPPGTYGLKFQIALSACAEPTGTVYFDDASLSVSDLNAGTPPPVSPK